MTPLGLQWFVPEHEEDVAWSRNLATRLGIIDRSIARVGFYDREFATLKRQVQELREENRKLKNQARQQSRKVNSVQKRSNGGYAATRKQRKR
jgi:hypothetical protein